MQCLLMVIGLASGLVVALALIALVVTFGVLNRLSQVTHTAKYIPLYEWLFISGSIGANIFYIFSLRIQCGYGVVLWIFGFFNGAYLGCVIGALAEIIQVLPIVNRTLHLEKYLKVIFYVLAAGKMAGACMHLLL